MYEPFYKLTANPFQLSPDPDLFYGSRGHRRALAYLQYGLAQKEGFIVVTGQVGTGKTMLVHALFNEINVDDFVSAKLVTTQLDEDQVLMMVAESFGLDCEGLGKAKILNRLEKFFIDQRAQGKRALLVVDEAQNIPKRSLEELRMLSNMQVSGKSLLQTFLLGQPEFSKTLYAPDTEQLLQRVIASYHLKPLGMDEVRSYIECRLGRVGWAGDPSFSKEAFQAIFSYTEGIPRRINNLCNRILLYGYLEELHQFTDESVLSVIRELDGEVPVVKSNERSILGEGQDQRLENIEQRLSAIEGGVRLERERIRRALAMMANKVKT
jgi:putative secretion ATPase (PEP-CTERM system associated)